MPNRKNRWICEEIQECLLALPSVYDICVKKDYDGKILFFPFRDDQGKMLMDPYESNVVGVEIDYMKSGVLTEMINVGKEGIEKWRADDVKKRIEKYLARFPMTRGSANLKQLGEMQEKLRDAICDSMGVNFLRENGDVSPSIKIDFSALSSKSKKLVYNVISELDSETVSVTVNINILGCDEERMYATLDRLALIDVQKEKKMKIRDLCSICTYGLLSVFAGGVAFYIGEFCVSLLKKDDSLRVVRCSEKDVDEYYFQKLEKFVDSRDSNEYTVLKFAGYRGCGNSELDSGFLAGDTVTFHLFVENLRYRTRYSKCLDSTCERGRYYPFAERYDACPAGWTVASAIQNAGLHFWKGGMTYYPTFSPILKVDSADPSGLKRLRSRLFEKNYGFVDSLELNLSGFYNVETERFEYVDSLSVVWTSDGFATVIPPNDYSEVEKKWTTVAMGICMKKPENLYPVRCIRIDDPKHIMDSPEYKMVTYYHNMRMLPYLFK